MSQFLRNPGLLQFLFANGHSAGKYDYGHPNPKEWGQQHSTTKRNQRAAQKRRNRKSHNRHMKNR